MVKCCRSQLEEMLDFDYRVEYLNGGSYIKQNIIMTVLRIAHSHSLLICRLIRKISNVKEDPRRETNSNFDFSKALHCLVLMRL